MTDARAIVMAIKAKPDWQRKVADPVIARRYAEEAARQGASQATIDAALHQLLEHTALQAESTLYIPLDPVHENDRDFRIEELEEDMSVWGRGPTRVPVRRRAGGSDAQGCAGEEEQKDHDEGEGYRTIEAHQQHSYNVRFQDGLVPDDLRQRLEDQLDAIARLPKKDFHPGSGRKVQDLIHPSLYPYIRGVSYDPNDEGKPEVDRSKQKKKKGEGKQKPKKRGDSEKSKGKKNKRTRKSDTEEKDADDGEDGDEAEMEEEDKQNEDDDEEEQDLARLEEMGLLIDQERQYMKQEQDLKKLNSIYQWLPAEFDVSPAGDVTIHSYINNLDRDDHAALYEDIAKLFRLFLPLFDPLLAIRQRLLTYSTATATATPSGRQKTTTRTKAVKNVLYGKRLQVIVKAANYILRPGETYEGTWHVEGMPHEHIVASGIYYYSTTANLDDMGLAFRTKRTNSMTEREDSHSLSFHINMGKVDTPEGRCLAFTNDMQHKVKKLTNPSDNVGVRKILCFFLVDPNVRVKSSADIPRQQWDEVRRDVTRCLIEASVQHGVRLPPEIVHRIVQLARWGISRKEAERHRTALMRERKYFVDTNNRLYERSFSFCEH